MFFLYFGNSYTHNVHLVDQDLMIGNCVSVVKQETENWQENSSIFYNILFLAQLPETSSGSVEKEDVNTLNLLKI